MSENSKPKALNNNISIRTWLARATKLLGVAGISSARLDAEIILADALRVERTWIIAHSEHLIPQTTAQEALQRRAEREPLAYIRGWQEFYGRCFIVTPDTLIPRPESEDLIEILQNLPPQSGTLIDVGTGSGCLGLTAALEFPEYSVILTDISSQALAVAQQNADILLDPALRAHIQFRHSHLLDKITETPAIIIANLPYVDTMWPRSPETEYEPATALFASSNGLELIYQLILQATGRLQPGGYLLLEADTRQIEAIASFATAHGFRVIAKKNFTIALQR